MKSSETLLSNGPIYSLLAVYMPLAVLTALAFLLKGLLSFSLVPLLVSGVLAALTASLYCDFMKDAKTGRTTADIRGGLVVMGIAYTFSSLFRWNVPWGERFFPNFSAILAAVGTLYVWVSVIALKQLFTFRRRLELYMASYNEEQLHKALFDDADLLQYTDVEISNTKQSYLIQLLIIGIMLLVNTAYNVSLPPALYLFLVCIVASGICIFGFLGIMRREHHHAAEGITLTAFARAKHMLSIGVFAVIPVIAAALLSSDKSFLPFSLVANFLEGIFGLVYWLFAVILMFFGRLLKLFFRESEVEPELAEIQPPPSFIEQVEPSEPWPFWTWLKYGLIVLAAAGFIWFMILPLLNRGASTEKMTFRQKLARIITEWLGGVRNGLADFFVFIKSGGTGRKLRRLSRKPSAGEVQRAAGAVLGAYSLAKKREMKQSVTLFAKLIIWGGEVRQVLWKPVYAPGEYCSLLAAASLEAPLPESLPEAVQVPPAPPCLNEKIIRCGELFEKALYSAEMLSDTERKEFKDMVEEITAFADNQRKESL